MAAEGSNKPDPILARKSVDPHPRTDIIRPARAIKPEAIKEITEMASTMTVRKAGEGTDHGMAWEICTKEHGILIKPWATRDGAKAEIKRMDEAEAASILARETINQERLEAEAAAMDAGIDAEEMEQQIALHAAHIMHLSKQAEPALTMTEAEIDQDMAEWMAADQEIDGGEFSGSFDYFEEPQEMQESLSPEQEMQEAAYLLEQDAAEAAAAQAEQDAEEQAPEEPQAPAQAAKPAKEGKGGRGANLHNFMGIAGCLHQQNNRKTGSLIQVLHSAQAGLSNASAQDWAPWACHCVTHGQIHYFPNRTAACRGMAEPWAWCGDCSSFDRLINPGALRQSISKAPQGQSSLGKLEAKVAKLGEKLSAAKAAYEAALAEMAAAKGAQAPEQAPEAEQPQMEQAA